MSEGHNTIAAWLRRVADDIESGVYKEAGIEHERHVRETQRSIGCGLDFIEYEPSGSQTLTVRLTRDPRTQA